MYLGAKSAQNSAKITPRIIEQMSILNNIISAVKAQKDGSLELQFMVDGLTKIKNTFESFSEVKSLEDENVGLGDINLTTEELNLLTEEITALRTKIVNG